MTVHALRRRSRLIPVNVCDPARFSVTVWMRAIFALLLALAAWNPAVAASLHGQAQSGAVMHSTDGTADRVAALDRSNQDLCCEYTDCTVSAEFLAGRAEQLLGSVGAQPVMLHPRSTPGVPNARGWTASSGAPPGPSGPLYLLTLRLRL